MKKWFLILAVILCINHRGITQSIDSDTTLCVNPVQKAEFQGSIGAFSKFLQKNLKYPEAALKTNATGKIYVEFIVEKDGSITHIDVLKNVGFGWNEEMIRVLKLSPKWIPAKDKGKIVRSKYYLPIPCIMLTEY